MTIRVVFSLTHVLSTRHSDDHSAGRHYWSSAISHCCHYLPRALVSLQEETTPCAVDSARMADFPEGHTVPSVRSQSAAFRHDQHLLPGDFLSVVATLAGLRVPCSVRQIRRMGPCALEGSSVTIYML